jgi:Retrotransposon gag protein/Zinc knuckle
MSLPADPAAALEQMQAAMLQLHQQMQQMQRAQQQQAVVPGGAPSAYAPRVERPRLPAPATYEGQASALDEWGAEMEQQYDWYGTHDEKERLRTATAFLRGAARDWWTHLASADRAAIDTWSALLAALRRRFQPVTTAAMARARLDTLAQGRQSVHEYVAAFRRLLIPLSDMGEADRLHAFTRGLKPTIATQLRVHGVQTTDAAIEMAVRVGSMSEFAALASAPAGAAASHGGAPMDLDELGIEGLEKETSGHSATGGADAPVTRAEFQQLLAAMQENRRGRSRPAASNEGRSAGPIPRDEEGRLRYGDLTRAQMDAHFTAGTCFNCGKPGHIARKCTKKQSN